MTPSSELPIIPTMSFTEVIGSRNSQHGGKTGSSKGSGWLLWRDRDGLLNPMNARAIRQLVRKGVVKADPQFHIMNESFRRFVCSATTDESKQAWSRESRRSGWGKVHGAFLTTMILLGAFLLTTQNALWHSAAAYVTTALGALGTIVKMFDNYRGGKSTERAS